MFWNFAIHNYDKKRTLLRGKENIFFFDENYLNCIAVSAILNKQPAITNTDIIQFFSLEISTSNLIAKAIAAITKYNNLIANK